jgi:hypothetical protein
VTVAFNAGDNEAVKIAGALEKNSTMKSINLANNHIKVCRLALASSAFEPRLSQSLVSHVARPTALVLLPKFFRAKVTRCSLVLFHICSKRFRVKVLHYAQAQLE